MTLARQTCTECEKYKVCSNTNPFRTKFFLVCSVLLTSYVSLYSLVPSPRLVLFKFLFRNQNFLPISHKQCVKRVRRLEVPSVFEQYTFFRGVLFTFHVYSPSSYQHNTLCTKCET